MLHQRGVVVIPDYVANGAANAWWWWILLGVIGPSAAEAFAQVDRTMAQTVEDALALADEKSVTPRAAADEIAMRNLDRLVEKLGEDASQQPTGMTS